MKIMSKMIKSSKKKYDSDSESEASGEGWKQNVSLVHQMYIATQFKLDNGMDSDDNSFTLDKDEIKRYLKKAKKAEKSLKRS